eukprot:snap_masked-scaffold_15-processed-gene-10.35-mRNA-1 protein AED:1.00 eAED:1.00 QI:0/0/0/0/1/1/3/0/688
MNRKRIRREIRTISNADMLNYFDTIQIMRNTTLLEGRIVYGEDFRSYEYLLIKHATSALHKCIDQGHIPANVLSFHRSFILEFENSFLSILQVLNPGSNLTGVPYWNWFIDLYDPKKISFLESLTGTNIPFFESSLWKYFGSPFGDPDNDFEISDGFFNTKLTRRTSKNAKEVEKLISEVFGSNNINNNQGFWRSPYNNNGAVGLSRNPGWAFGVPLGWNFLKKEKDDCLKEYDLFRFSLCTSGLGVSASRKSEIRFGPHFGPHVSMGSFDDEQFTQFHLLPFYIFNFIFILYLFQMKIVQNLKYLLVKETRNLTIVSIFGIFSFCLMLFLIRSTFGIYGWRFNYEFYSLTLGYTYPNLVNWRNGFVECDPFLNSCSTKNVKMNSKIMKGLSDFIFGEPYKFSSSDYWSNSHSANENFFFSIHAFYDLLHIQWENEKLLQLEFSRTSGKLSEAEYLLKKQQVLEIDETQLSIFETSCPGTKFDDVLSPEFCFARKDLVSSKDWNTLNATDFGNSHSKRTPNHSLNPAEPCLTLREAFTFPFDAFDEDIYVYDRMLEPFSYVSVEKQGICPEFTSDCTQEFASKYIGEVLCVNNTASSIDNLAQVDEAYCRSAGLYKPDPPVKVCNCDHERLKKKTLAHRRKILFHRYLIPLIGLMFSLALGAFSMLGRRFSEANNKLRYEKLNQGQEK